MQQRCSVLQQRSDPNVPLLLPLLHSTTRRQLTLPPPALRPLLGGAQPGSSQRAPLPARPPAVVVWHGRGVPRLAVETACAQVVVMNGFLVIVYILCYPQGYQALRHWVIAYFTGAGW